MVAFNTDKIPTYKMAVHIAQIVLSVTIWCLEIAVFKGGDINGRNGWTFGVCFLCVPAWIYLIMAPRYERAANIAQPNAMLTVDAIFTIIWLSAFATQAAYNSANSCGTACGVSKAIVGVGVFETLLWAASTFISFATLRYFNTNGVLPGYDNLQSRNSGRAHTINNIDPDKAAFSTGPVDEEGVYAPLGGGMRDDDDEHEFNAGPYNNAPHDPDSFGHHNTAYGGAAASTMGSRYDNDGGAYGGAGAGVYGGETAYGGAGAGVSHSPAPAGGNLYSPPAVHDEDYDQHQPAQFPAADYDNLGFRSMGVK